MRKIVFSCLIVMMAISFGCEKEEISKDQSISIQANKVKRSITVNHTDFRKNFEIIGDNLIVYIDYNDGVEFLNSLPTDDVSIGSNDGLNSVDHFIANYRAEMTANFTIYSIQESSIINCGYVDKWIVNANEYFAYFPNTFGVTVFDTTTSAVRKKPTPTQSTQGNGGNNDDDYEMIPDSIINLTGPNIPYDLCF
nr:hypothetical protein [uncultured Psychroserpens sp.]